MNHRDVYKDRTYLTLASMSTIRSSTATLQPQGACLAGVEHVTADLYDEAHEEALGRFGRPEIFNTATNGCLPIFTETA